ncbi:MAG: folylpolyglutamate synthase/dihydrofolate synthase family protein [Thermoanaerobaculia bacterium]
MPGARSLEAILGALEGLGMRLGLAPFAARLAALGHPERDLPAVVVAGTNGKGSVASLLAAMLRGAGYRAGLYTSPHLESPTERIRVDGRAIAETRLALLLEEVLAAGDGKLEPPTYFEALTAAALLEFSRSALDCAVLEVGLGGRLDATNLAETRLTVVSPIALDHEAILGSTLGEIAREKAGIFRPGIPAILAAQEPEARRALDVRAREIGAPVVDAARGVRWLSDPGARPLGLASARASYRLSIALAGRHQADNVATAVVAAEILAERGFRSLDATAIERGAAAWRWPGRLETVVLPPPAPEVLFDAAHNPAGATTLAAHWRALGGRGTLLFGALADKRIDRMLPALAACADRIVLTRPDSARAAAPEDLRALVPGALSCAVEPHIDAALDLALAGEPRRVVIGGSLFLAGAARRALRLRYGLPPPPGPTFVE